MTSESLRYTANINRNILTTTTIAPSTIVDSFDCADYPYYPVVLFFKTNTNTHVSVKESYDGVTYASVNRPIFSLGGTTKLSSINRPITQGVWNYYLPINKYFQFENTSTGVPTVFQYYIIPQSTNLSVIPYQNEALRGLAETNFNLNGRIPFSHTPSVIVNTTPIIYSLDTNTIASGISNFKIKYIDYYAGNGAGSSHHLQIIVNNLSTPVATNLPLFNFRARGDANVFLGNDFSSSLRYDDTRTLINNTTLRYIHFVRSTTPATYTPFTGVNNNSYLQFGLEFLLSGA